jgi:hypothetical protein
MKIPGVKLLTTKLPRPRPIYFRWSASYIHSAFLVGWKRMKMSTGGEDTNKLGVGAVIQSDWLFNDFNKKARHGLPKKHYLLRPYMELYLDDPNFTRKPRKVRRPSLKELYP